MLIQLIDKLTNFETQNFSPLTMRMRSDTSLVVSLKFLSLVPKRPVDSRTSALSSTLNLPSTTKSDSNLDHFIWNPLLPLPLLFLNVAINFLVVVSLVLATNLNSKETLIVDSPILLGHEQYSTNKKSSDACSIQKYLE